MAEEMPYTNCLLSYAYFGGRQSTDTSDHLFTGKRQNQRVHGTIL